MLNLMSNTNCLDHPNIPIDQGVEGTGQEIISFLYINCQYNYKSFKCIITCCMVTCFVTWTNTHDKLDTVAHSIILDKCKAFLTITLPTYIYYSATVTINSKASYNLLV